MAVICYSISRVFKQYFSTTICRQKNDHNILIHHKWLSSLEDIKCKPGIFDILLLPTFATNAVTIFGIIDIVQELEERLELTDEIVKDKLILIKRDLMIISNYQHIIFW